MTDLPDSSLLLRPLLPEDYEAVADLQRRCFPTMAPWSEQAFRAQLNTFPEGQIAIFFEDRLVATSTSLIVSDEDWREAHSHQELSSDGMITHHDPEGDTLYGIDIAVDPDFRGMRFARRIYDHRKQLIRRLNLRHMFIAARLPGLKEHPTLSIPEYVAGVLRKELVDEVLTTQLAMGFAIVEILEDYLPNDTESRGAAVLLEWTNAEWLPQLSAPKRTARVASVQYGMRPVRSFEEFASQCAYYADLASDFRCDFLLFPELLTNQLIPLVEPMRNALRVRQLDQFTDRYLETFRTLAIKHNVNIIGGTHLIIEDEKLYNVAYLFHRNGKIDKQYKLHITPAEARWWGVSPGDELRTFDTDCGKIGILICYDVEFPELSRVLKQKGANMIFVPYNTDIRAGHLRVRTCAHARCVENNVYVITSGMCGALPTIDWAEIHFARSAVLTPSDVPFPRDGIATEAHDNIETMLVAELDLALLRRMHRQGEVRTWVDRRKDLYHVSWHAPGDEDQI